LRVDRAHFGGLVTGLFLGVVVTEPLVIRDNAKLIRWSEA
jgi:hypothetical protein